MKQNCGIVTFFWIIFAIVAGSSLNFPNSENSQNSQNSDTHDDIQFMFNSMGRTAEGSEPEPNSENRRENEILAISPGQDHTERLMDFAADPGIKLPPNVVKYLEKRQYCKWQSYTMNVTRAGCEPAPVTNRMCYGACGSFAVANENGQLREICESCTAVFRDEEIRLNCEDGEKMTVIKVVNHCECRPCEHRCD